MPVYNAKRKVKSQDGITSKPKFAKRRLVVTEKWGYNGVNIKPIEKLLDFPIMDHIGKLCKTTSPVVVDWGCGKAISTEEIARANPNARVYGFSKESYLHWNLLFMGGKTKKGSASKNLKLIHAEANDFFRYFKNSSIDFMFSRLGLVHLKNLPLYLERVVPKLKVGGMIITDSNYSRREFLSILKISESGIKIGEPKIVKVRNGIFKKPTLKHIYSFPNFEIEFSKRSEDGKDIIILRRTK